MSAAQSRQAEAAAERQPSQADYNAFVASLSLAAINVVAIGGERREPGEASKTRYELSAGCQIDETSIHYRFDVDSPQPIGTGQVLDAGWPGVIGQCTDPRHRPCPTRRVADNGPGDGQRSA